MNCTITSVNICNSNKGSKRNVCAKMSIAERELASGAYGLELTCFEETVRGTGERSPDAAAVYQRKAELYLSPEEVREIVRAAARIGIRLESPPNESPRRITLVKK